MFNDKQKNKSINTVLETIQRSFFSLIIRRLKISLFKGISTAPKK